MQEKKGCICVAGLGDSEKTCSPHPDTTANRQFPPKSQYCVCMLYSRLIWKKAFFSLLFLLCWFFPHLNKKCINLLWLFFCYFWIYVFILNMIYETENAARLLRHYLLPCIQCSNIHSTPDSARFVINTTAHSTPRPMMSMCVYCYELLRRNYIYDKIYFIINTRPLPTKRLLRQSTPPWSPITAIQVLN